jgi:hypothetical protein
MVIIEPDAHSFGYAPHIGAMMTFSSVSLIKSANTVNKTKIEMHLIRRLRIGGSSLLNSDIAAKL